MRAFLSFVLVAALCTGALSGPAYGAAPDPARAWLRGELDKLAADDSVKGANIGVVVARAGDGVELYTRAPDRLVNIASNAKIITSSAALSLLGPEFRFKTEVYAPGYKGGDVVAGDIYLKGYGDPSLRVGDLDRLAALIRELGVSRVEGGLVYDESYFDEQRDPPRFETRSTDAYYRPVVGALSLEENTVSLRVRAGRRPGAPARVMVMPRSRYVTVENRTMTVNRRRRTRVRVATRRKGQNTLVRVRGRVRLGFRGRWRRKRISHAGLFCGTTFLEALARRGIRVKRTKIRRGRVPKRAKKPLAAIHSRALGDLVRRLNKVSSNFMAEQVLKVMGAERIGKPGSFDKGLDAVAKYLEKLGIAKGSYVLKNGSGLYDASSVSPRQLSKVLRAAHLDFRYGADFVASLAIAGVDGTLGHRFIGSGAERYVRAKTGTLADVVSLSGYAAASKGKKRSPLVFSILVSNLSAGQIGPARRVADAMARLLVTYLER